MSRLIDADALLALIKKRIKNTAIIGWLCRIIDEAPTIDAVPVVHGRWIDVMVRDWRCSECEGKVPKQVRFDGYCYDDKLNYCPNCGARMDLEVDGNES